MLCRGASELPPPSRWSISKKSRFAIFRFVKCRATLTTAAKMGRRKKSEIHLGRDEALLLRNDTYVPVHVIYYRAGGNEG